ncbi:MAG: PLP-dependent aminotransferase family protein, partial [Planctomycetota bacterium]
MTSTDSPYPPGSDRRTRRIRQYNASQLRMDTWNELQIHANWLHEYARLERDADEPRRLVTAGLETLRSLEFYWAFPGIDAVEELTRLHDRRAYGDLSRRVSQVSRLLVGDAYRERGEWLLEWQEQLRRGESPDQRGVAPLESSRPYFEVLVVDNVDDVDRQDIRRRLHDVRRDEDDFVYDVVVVPSFEDAVIAALFNRTIQSVILRYSYAYFTTNRHEVLQRYLDLLAMEGPTECYGLARSLALGRLLKRLRPELDLFLVTDTPLDEVAGSLGRDFRRAFYRLEQYMELHLSLLKGIQSRYETPFFDALRRYSEKPTGVFHALPIARGKSMTTSHWARDMAQFYGTNIFLAETSTTSGGLDSLLQPRGPIKRAQQLAARAFGSHETFFVTNGTSTANKIVVQALVRPGDIVLACHDCHKSHHYAIMLAGAFPVYLDAYPLTEHSMYGGVPLEEIKRRLFELKRAGKLDRVRMLLLTNCTFDGITYDPERIMREVLAIKPDMIFLWDEAWFAFGTFSPTLRRRTAMATATRLREMFRSAGYREAFARWKADFIQRDPDDEATWLDGPLMADPEVASVRVYATHSTHKTLTALRQGSMIHVFDEQFEQKSSDAFHEAYMTHTSTSPNYQIIASLDVGRRQVELEGYELVQRSVGLAMALRERIYEHPVISKYFTVLRPADMIPERFRPSGLEFYYDPEKGWERMESGYRTDEFVLDPTRVTVDIGRTGMDGDTFR